MFRFIYFFLFLPLTIVNANAITLNCQFNEKINPTYANEIMCGMDSKVWGGKQFDLCDFKTSLAGAYISGLVLKNNKGQILNKWSQSFINYAIKKDGSLPKKSPYDNDFDVLFYHFHKKDEEKKYAVLQHHFVLKSDINYIYTLFVDERTSQAFLESKLSYGTGEPKNKLSTWRQTKLGFCEVKR